MSSTDVRTALAQEPLSEAQVVAFEQDGCVTVESGLSAAQLAP